MTIITATTIDKGIVLSESLTSEPAENYETIYYIKKTAGVNKCILKTHKCFIEK